MSARLSVQLCVEETREGEKNTRRVGQWVLEVPGKIRVRV
jgi:hypothetical protein